MSDDLEKRLVSVERMVDRNETALDYIKKTLDDIKDDISESLTFKTKVDNINQQVNAMWKKIDSNAERITSFESNYSVLKHQHDACMKEKETDRVQNKTFIKSRVGSIIDQAIPILISLLAAGAFIKYGGK